MPLVIVVLTSVEARLARLERIRIGPITRSRKVLTDDGYIIFCHITHYIIYLKYTLLFFAFVKSLFYTINICTYVCFLI